MIKARLEKKDGGDVVLVGMSWANFDRIREGKPMVVKLRELNLPDIEVVLFGGETEDSIRDELMSHFDVGEYREQRD